MQFRLWLILAAICVLSLGATANAQSATHNPTRNPEHSPAASKRYCQPQGGFCFRYPGTWSMQGEVFAGNGVVVAPEQKQERALWDEITVAMIVPAPQADADPVSVNQLIEQTMASLREEGQNLETLQRQVRTIDGQPAQLLTVRYREKASDREWIEKLAFIQGSAGEIYSVALKCSPQSLARLEPALSSVLQSWKLPEPVPPAESGEPSPPKTAAPAQPPAAEPPKN